MRSAVLVVFSLKTTDEDQALLWYTTKELAHGAIHAPFLYGQRYGSWLEALVAVPLYIARVPLRVALPVTATALNLAAWLLVAYVARRRGAPALAMVFLAWAVTLTLEYHEFASMPRGIFPGVFLAVAAVVPLLSRARSGAWSWVLFGFGAVAAGSFNAGAILVVAPVAIYVLTETKPSSSELIAGASGGAAGLLLYVVMQLPYVFRPAYSIHQSPSVRVSPRALASAHFRQTFSMYSFSFWRGSLGIASVVALVAVLCLRSRRRSVVLSLVGLTVFIVFLLANPKISDGSPNIFFPYARFFGALPFALCMLVLFASEHLVLVPSRLVVIGNMLVVAAAAGTAIADLPRQADDVVRSAAHVSTVVPYRIDELTRKCATLKRLATREHAHIVVFLTARTYAYACDALWASDVETLFPIYERRAWLMEKESRTMRTIALVVSDSPFCPRVRRLADCRSTTERGVDVISFPPQSVLRLLAESGIETRPRV